MTPEIVREGQFTLHVYPKQGEAHAEPHCHVRRRGGGPETMVSLVSLEVMIGPALTRKERRSVKTNQDRLRDEWDKGHE